MSGLMPRRGFLSGLVGLPLVGGAVSLIGHPTAVAKPVTRSLQERYIAWLANEHAAALIEYQRPGIHHIEPYAWPNHRCTDMAPMYWFPEGHDDLYEALWLPTAPSARAALVLSAVGCDWRGPYVA